MKTNFPQTHEAIRPHCPSLAPHSGLLYLVAALLTLPSVSQASALGTTFTYQGRLASGNQPANGVFEFRFAVFDAVTGGGCLGGPLTNAAVNVADGCFTTTIDLGPGAFNGQACWLEIAVRSNGGTGAFHVLAPRQQLTPAPYALYAANASGVVDNAISAAGIAGGQVVKSVNGLKDAVLLAAGPNVTLSTNGNILQISAGTNTGGGGGLVGYKENGAFATPPLATGNNAIAQGEHAQALGNNSVVGGGLDNLANHWFTTIGGGWSNTAAGLLFGRTTIGGGEMNLATGDWSTIGGGQLNTAGGPFFGRATISGGWQNTASGDISTISGGSQNSAVAGHGVISGGQSNSITPLQAAYAAIGGGSQNIIGGGHGHIGGGQSNSITTLQAPWSTISGGHLNQVSAMSSTIGGGVQNTVSGWSGVVGGGNLNRAGGDLSFVGGGELNVASNNHTTVGGGNQNQANGDAATVGGGNVNLANGVAATVPGGYNNRASGDYSFAAGQSALAHARGSMVFADSQYGDFISMQPDEFAVRAFNGMRLQTDVGIHLDANDRPLIVRDWDRFASTAANGKANIGRWGLFMEPGALVMGIPDADVGPRSMEVARYKPDGSREKLFGVSNNGVTTVKVLTITGGSDLAEPFEVSDSQPVPKGAVMVIDDQNPGRLRVSTQAYDKRVAGVVSGAGGLEPGLTITQEGVTDHGAPVALSGRVYTLADADNVSIQPGDLLTTSSVPGHAMKVEDQARAQGAIIGKAMTALPKGRGLILVLVSLQ